MDWAALFFLIFSLLVLILAIANAIFFWKAYSLPLELYSQGYSLTLFIANVLIAIIAVIALLWSIYIMVRKPKILPVEKPSLVVEKPSLVVEKPSLPPLSPPRCQLTVKPSASAFFA